MQDVSGLIDKLYESLEKLMDRGQPSLLRLQRIHVTFDTFNRKLSALHTAERKRRQIMARVGDIVTWESQGRGVKKAKTGKIVLIVPANRIANIMWHELPEAERKKYTVPKKVFHTAMRTEDSYVVAVLKDAKSKPQIYWPHAKSLKPVDTGKGET